MSPRSRRSGCLPLSSFTTRIPSTCHILFLEAFASGLLRSSEQDRGQVSTGDMGTNFLTFSLLNDFWLFITSISSSSNYGHIPNANLRIKSIQSKVAFRATVVQLEGTSRSKPVRQLGSDLFAMGFSADPA